MHPVVTLHRYYMWATFMAAQFEKELPQLTHATNWAEPMALHAYMFLSYWFATLYVVTEGWRDLGLTDPAVDALIDNAHRELFRRYRNGVYHFQPDYISDRCREFLDEGKDALEWVNKLHGAFTTYFTRWMDTHNLDGTPK